MIYRRLYYHLKPILPAPLRIGLRRILAKRKRSRSHQVWPINPAAAQAPVGWQGWPDGKRFGLVLTHDVEGQRGLNSCANLLELEKSLGFRSSFNFIPEGVYRTPPELRRLIESNGFEVGVHDLHHDGKLFGSRERFTSHAREINRYLAEWNAVGFRAGFMLHNLEWLHELNIAYDSSTFDTDPFEPQPDGVHTIFPFWVAGKKGKGYVELPYTLPQDSTLFVVFEEKTIDIWKQKLDWIVEHGGMALLNMHPDHLAASSSKGRSHQTSCRSMYPEFLEYVRSKYAGAFWNALPREIAQFVKGPSNRVPMGPSVSRKKKERLWIDLDNTPHVPFFEPIIHELNERGYELLVTARDAFQVCELAEHKRLPYIRIGRHYGKNPFMKIAGLVCRAAELIPHALKAKPLLAVSHGSRSQIMAGTLLGIPTVLLADYEHARHLPFMRPGWEIVPEAIPDEGLYCPKERIRKYPGIKEDVYVGQFRPDARIGAELGLKQEATIVTVRPPATEAHYHNPQSEVLFFHFMERACAAPGLQLVLLPRNQRQADTLRRRAPHWFSEGRTIIPSHAVDGLNLLWHSDLVVSGGGTMNREAAALGVPVYSIFRGRIGAVDRFLADRGGLVLIKSVEDVDGKIHFSRRKRKSLAEGNTSRALSVIVEHLETILQTNRSNA